MGDIPAATILVADDDPDILELVCLRLEMAGHQTIQAVDGAAALELARSELPDLCILDVLMPKMSGFEVLGELRASEETSRLLVVLLTASVQSQDVSQGFQVGADDYLRKTFDSRELCERVEALLGRARRFVEAGSL